LHILGAETERHPLAYARARYRSNRDRRRVANSDLETITRDRDDLRRQHILGAQEGGRPGIGGVSNTSVMRPDRTMAPSCMIASRSPIASASS
jgi:hypothetical protein